MIVDLTPCPDSLKKIYQSSGYYTKKKMVIWTAFCRFSEGSARASERPVSRLQSRAFCLKEQEKRDTARSLMVIQETQYDK